MSIRIIVAGANGKMGQEVLKMIAKHDHLQLVGGVSRTYQGKDIGAIYGGQTGINTYASVEEALHKCDADVMVDFTTPQVVKNNAELALQYGVSPVVGTTGLHEQDLKELDELSKERGVGCIIAPNFAVGAVLMMLFSAKATKHLPHVEIVESHHDQKLDSPSGTAIKTAEIISKVRKEMKQGHSNEKEVMEGARGAYYNGFRIHSVRLPGLVAHQEVLLSGEGQLLSIRHDTYDRAAFMPGVRLAIEKVVNIKHLVYGLEELVQEEYWG